MVFALITTSFGARKLRELTLIESGESYAVKTSFTFTVTLVKGNKDNPFILKVI